MDTRQFIAEHLNDDVHDLALRKTPAGVDKTLALCQIEARQLLMKKVPSWSRNEALLFPPHLSIEQCSSEATAQYKASLMQGNSFVDLTGGLGVDCYFISQNFKNSDYVELNAELCELARHNFMVLWSSLIPAKAAMPSVINESAEDYLLHCQSVDCFFLDPARRDSYGRKTVSIADCTPNVVKLQELLLQNAHRVMVKLSPMLDISQALKELHRVSEVHVVAVGNECKELLFLMESGFEGDPVCSCVNLQSGQPVVTFSLREESDAVSHLATKIESYLYEPNAALMKGGCYKLLTKRFGVMKLHPNSHLFTSDQLVADFPGRIFAVDGWELYSKRVGKTLLAGVSGASIAVRNFPLTVSELRKIWKIADGDAEYLFATTLAGDQKVIIKATKL